MMNIKTKTSPFIRDKQSTIKIIIELSIALFIVYLFGLYRYTSYGSNYIKQGVLLLIIAESVSFGSEYLFAYFTKKDLKKVLLTSFPWVTPLIIVLMSPINTSLYAMAIGTFIGVFFGKLVFGGFGQNIFNPAGVGRCVILTSFAGSLADELITSATPLTTLASGGWLLNKADFAVYLNDFGGISNLLIGNYSGAIGETCTILILFLGIILSILHTIDWYIPFTYLTTIFFGSLFIGIKYGLGIEFPIAMIASGGAAFGAVFMLTDPVTNPNTKAGKIIFASLAAFLTMLIRLRAALPEGVLYSILLVNILTPAIEKYFYGKTVDYEKRNNILIISTYCLSIVFIFLSGFTLPMNSYESILVPTFEHGETVSLDTDFSIYDPVLESQDGNLYYISCKGYALLPKEEGGEGSLNQDKRNLFLIELNEDNTIKSISFEKFSDTVRIGDKATNKGFLLSFEGIDLNSSIDVVAGATYTSKSAIAAANFVLNGCPEKTHYQLNADLPDYEAQVIDTITNDDGSITYHVKAKGFGTLGNGKGDIYSLNEFLITIKDHTLIQVVCSHFGDTPDYGDSAVSDKYLANYIGLKEEDEIDVRSGATYTSRSLIASISVAFKADRGE